MELNDLKLDIIKMGFIRGGTQSACGSCQGDNDRNCSSICIGPGCTHDGCCGTNNDAGGEPAGCESQT